MENENCFNRYNSKYKNHTNVFCLYIFDDYSNNSEEVPLNKFNSNGLEIKQMTSFVVEYISFYINI